MSTPAGKPVLELRSITKHFGHLRALNNASLLVHSGRIHALLGENGAGKSTLARIAFGMISLDDGLLLVDDVPRRFRSAADAGRAGIGMVQQHFLNVPAMTVAENVAIGLTGDRSPFHPFSPSAAGEHVHSLGRSTGLVLDPTTRAADLSIAGQQRLELLRALARSPRVLILDEPTAVLTGEQSAELYRWLRRFADGGGSVVLITHKIGEALAVADEATILRSGATILRAPTAALREEDAVEAMLGASAVAWPVPERAAPSREVIYSLQHVTVIDRHGVTRLRDATVEVHAGEVVGVLGVEGSGQRELLRVLTGRVAPSAGIAVVPSRAGFVPEDRLHDAVIPEWSLEDNVLLAEAGILRGRLRRAEARRRATGIVSDFDIRHADAGTLLRSLSGGNQQRFVLGRELGAGARGVVLESPTRGLDVRATQYVHATVRSAARERRMAVVFASSETEEVLALADRVIVCFAAGVSVLSPADPAAVSRTMVGLA